MHKIFCLSFILLACSVFAQDSAVTRGTIKIKQHADEIYIRAYANYPHYDIPGDAAGSPAASQVYPPLPVVEAYSRPFDYSAYFSERFRNIPVDLKHKATDTVRIQLSLSAGGKIMLSDAAYGGIPAPAKRAEAEELPVLHYDCLMFLRSIRHWEPAFVLMQHREKFRGQTVIKPQRRYVDAEGIVTIVFSSVPFEEE